MNKLKATLNHVSNQGFVLPVAVGMGLIIVLVATTLIFRSQGGQVTALARKQTGESLAVAEGGIARTLAQFTQPNNADLLTQNYDSINPNTGKTYLGPDAIQGNGDEENTAVNQWTSAAVSSPCAASATLTPNVTYTATIGANGQYTLKAYRYNTTSETGTFLVEGQKGTSAARIAVTISIDSTVGDFPGVLAVEKMELLGRSVIGSNGNVYYDPAFSTNPSLTESAAVGDATRPNYLNAIKSGSNDSFSIDNVSGKIIACKLTPTFSYAPQGTNLGDITGNLTITGSGGISYYQANKIDIENSTLDVNTTNGTVYLYVNGPIVVKGTAKIRNIRSDGLPPRVGDLRIIVSTTDQTQIDDSACIQNAFLYSRRGNLQMGGSGDGCPSSGNTNIDGVVWVRELTKTSGNFSGIAVPDDVSSLSDLSNSLGLPTVKKFGTVKSWQRQKL